MQDKIWCYEFQMRHLLILQDCIPPLPCQEVLWKADSALQWQQVRKDASAMPSLYKAFHCICLGNWIEPTMNDFSRILLIHALYSRTWGVPANFEASRNHWMLMTSGQDPKALDRFQGRIRSSPEFSCMDWTIVACDCLDILHWHANTVTGTESGVERPILLHLHLARIVLLTPLRAICDLAYGLVRQHFRTSSAMPDQSLARNCEIVRLWVESDRCKARLAMYHAGALFRHVRFYSAKSYYEPPAVMLAALALWAWDRSRLDLLRPHRPVTRSSRRLSLVRTKSAFPPASISTVPLMLN